MYALVPCAELTLFAGVLLFGVECVTTIASEDNWEVTTPESVGIDSSKLSPLVARFKEWKEANLHGVIVVRHGKLVFEHYFRGFDLKARDGPATIDFNAATAHDLRSMTKSVTALVLGAAIDHGIIADVDQSVLSFFTDYADLGTPEKDRITIRHLLTMSMGLAWSDDAPYTNENTLNASLDPYRHVLSLPVVEPAGLVWNYSGGATALIGGILRRATGKRFDVLAAALLFDPLGIADVTWTWLPNGDPKDWCCLWLRPRDMAKIGQLVLDRGRWKEARVVSESWINAAAAPQIKTTQGGYYYGYQFWLGASSASSRRIDWVAAAGQGGQRIFIVPTLDLVAVVTAGNYYGNDRLATLVPQTVFEEYLLPSVAVAR
jgi:CubicO group peptidase (beta-lactamase class C family)